MVPRVNEWGKFAHQSQAKATAIASVPFVLLALLLNYCDTALYGGSTHGIALAAITILYLVLTAALGFISPLGVASIGAVLAHGIVTLLWLLVPGVYGDETYESGWVGIAVRIAVASVALWVSAFAGNLLVLQRRVIR